VVGAFRQLYDSNYGPLIVRFVAPSTPIILAVIVTMPLAVAVVERLSSTASVTVGQAPVNNVLSGSLRDPEGGSPMRRSVMMSAVALALTLCAATGRASEEEIHPWKKVSLVANTGQHFGDVTVTAEGTVGVQPLLTALTITVKGKTLVVPSAALRDLPGLQLHTLQVRSEAGYDRDPWLYLVMALWRPGRPAAVATEEVHFAIQQGKLKHRAITTRTRDGQVKRDKKDFK